VLIDNVGAGPGDTIPPKLWFVRPGNGAVLPANFVFEVTAGDDLRVHHVDLFFDGKKVAELPQPPYIARVTGASDGEHTLKAIVYDWKPNEVSAETKVTIDNSCVLDGRCNGGVPGPGAGCATGTDCGSGICVLAKDGKGLCAQGCNGVDDICPEGTECKLSGGAKPAAPAPSGDAGAGSSSSKETWACTKELDGFTFDVVKSGGGCAVGRGASLTSGGGLLLLLLGLLALRRRR
jgi:MYXO-CTERM domain-containing protein